MTHAEAAQSTYAELLEKNRRFLWNPFTQMQEYLDGVPVVVVRGEGVRLFDVEGRAYYDGNGSVWVNIHGHNRRELNDALIEQLERIAHSTLLGMASVPALELAERLVQIAPGELAKVFFSEDGAEAVEVALKLAFGYWQRCGRPQKRRFLTMENAYHGDTLGAMGVGGIDLFQREFRPLLVPAARIPFPQLSRYPGSAQECAERSLAALRSELEQGDVAALIVEPLVQGAAGVVTMPAGFLTELAGLCRRYEALLIADEVATGFGRTGAMFACEHEGVAPDLMAVGKGLTGGYLPVAATLATDEVYGAFCGSFAERRSFLHGHSYAGNQLGCAVALASLDLFEQDGLLARVRESASLVAHRLARLGQLAHVGELRQCGLLVGVELVRDRATKEPYGWREAVGARVCRRACELGLITRPLGDVVTLVPPLASEQEDLEAMLSIVEQAIVDVTGR